LETEENQGDNMKLSFRIRKRYFDLIVKGEKTVEYRRDIEFWQIRIHHIFEKLLVPLLYPIANTKIPFSFPLTKEDNVLAVFICGKQIHRRIITKIERIPTPDYFSEQGQKDVNTPTCLGFHLGDVV
jgi:hypothetical protein